MGNYLPSTAAERAAMLAAIGAKTIDDLYKDVPSGLTLDALDIPHGISELELRANIEAMAAKNTVFSSLFRGAGAYNRFIPALVKTVTTKEEFVTAYTPYQAEISQGVLQSIFEYQTMMCQLTGLDVSNASLYDGATAAAEAVFMCQDRKRSSVVISGTVNPQVIETVQTYCARRNTDVVVVPPREGAVDLDAFSAALGDTCACALFQQPNFFGVLEDADALVAAIHAAGAKAIMHVEPTSLGLLKTPGEVGADICTAEGQPLGLPLSFGGPYLGIITCTQALLRKLPGRIVGQTQDAQGKRVFVLTLQAREQHIRREKASSNVCSNQALCALAAGVYLATMGPAGLSQVASLSYAKAHYAARQICAIDGFDLVFDQPFFNEFVTTCPVEGTQLESALAAEGILGGLPLEGGILWCVTEMNSKEQIDRLVQILRKVA
ncbi:MAG: aminomethyl-transferring glycine dehydrogenase subunit GcvPA [Raoultibacter sp.]